MRWFVGLHPKYYQHADQLLRDFLDSGADILFSHPDFGLEGSYETKTKILVLFLENPSNRPEVEKKIFLLLKEAKEKWSMVIAVGASDKRMKELVTSFYPERNWVPHWTVLPYTYLLYQQKVPPTYGDYLMAWVTIEAKGKREINAASVFLNIKIHDYLSGGPTVWSQQMHHGRGLIWAATHDSISRAFTSAAVSQKPAILLRTTAQLFENYGDIGGQEFYESVLIRYDLWDWLTTARRILDDEDYAIEWGMRLHQFFEKYEEFWKWEILWERFYDQTGLKLPKDMTVAHHLPPNYFGKDYFSNPDYFPQGPWSNEPISVNWETGLGI